MSRQPSILLTLLCLVLGLALAPTAASAQGAEADGPTYQMPTVGSCLQLTVGEYRRLEHKDPVDCATEHTVLVTAVEVLPEDTDWTLGGAALEAAEDQYCMPAYYETLGRKFRLIARSAFVWGYSIPNEEQRAHGAAWFRCDIILPGAVTFLPQPHPIVLTQDLPLQYTSCMIRLADTWYHSTCTDGYTHRFVKVIILPGEAYPTVKAARKQAEKRCRKGRDQGQDRWFYRWSFEPAWVFGDHTLTCYRKV